MKQKKAIITGITGQDGSYLAELLLKKKYQVHGLLRRTSFLNLDRIQHIVNKYETSGQLTLHYIDMIDTSSISSLVKKIKPNEFYNLAAMSHVGISFYTGEATLNINALATYRILDAISKNHKDCKFYQASSSEMFGITPPPQNENSLFNPQSPYGISKVAAFYTTRYFRQAHKMFAANGILFNHESPRRGINFVTRKITYTVARILIGKEKKLILGNVSIKRDWGHAEDYVLAIWKILQQKKPDDFVIATEMNHTIWEFVKEVFKIVGLNVKKYVEINNPKFLRPAEVPSLKGDSSKAKRILKWKARYKFKDIARILLENDLKIHGLNIQKARIIAKKIN